MRACAPSYACRGLLVTTLALLGFGSVVWLAAHLVAWQSGADDLRGPALAVGVLCGLVACLFACVFHLRREWVRLPFDDRAVFAARLRSRLEELGYRVTESGDALTARPAFHAFLLGGAVQATLSDGAAEVRGPRVYLEMLRRGLRQDHQLAQLPRAMASARHRRGEKLLSRVFVRVQVPAELLEVTYRELAAALASQGAAVECDLRLSARSDAGLSDDVLQVRVADWLHEQQIPYEIEREPLEEVHTHATG